jgi:hypothetical protein
MHTNRVMARKAKEKGPLVSYRPRWDRGVKMTLNLGIP